MNVENPIQTIDPNQEFAQSALLIIFGIPICIYLVFCIYGNLTAKPQPYAGGLG